MLAACLSAAQPALAGGKPSAGEWRPFRPATQEAADARPEEPDSVFAPPAAAPDADSEIETVQYRQRYTPRTARAYPRRAPDLRNVDPLDDPFSDPFAAGDPPQGTGRVRPGPILSQPQPHLAPPRGSSQNRPAPKPIVSQPLLRTPPPTSGLPRLEPPTAEEPLAQAPRPGESAPRAGESRIRSGAPTDDAPPLLPAPDGPSTLDQALQPCPSSENLKKIKDVTTTIGAKAGEFPRECELTPVGDANRAFPELVYTWKASGMCSKPLYFEDEQLERYGRVKRPLLQPVKSGVKFFAGVGLLPYKMGVQDPRECVYALGYYRPGSCVPRFRNQVLPVEIDGLVYEAGLITGLIFLLP